MTPNSLFSDILLPVSLEDFANSYFYRKPLHLEGNAGRYSFLPHRDELERLIVSATDRRAVFGGLKQASIKAQDCKDMFDAGATICLTGLENGDNRLSELIESAKESLSYSGQVSVRGYWSPRGSGFDVHYDPRVATTLQLWGEKQWWYTSTPPVDLPLGNSPYPLSDSLMMQIADGEVCTAILKPGDMLCLPPGVWHWARASGDGDDCFALNLAFDYLNGGIGDIVAAALRRRMNSFSKYRNPLFSSKGTDEFEADEAIRGLSESCRDAALFLNDLAESQQRLSALWRECI